MLASRFILVHERRLDENAIASATSSFRWFDIKSSTHGVSWPKGPGTLVSGPWVAQISRVCSSLRKESFRFDDFFSPIGWARVAKWTR